MDDILDSSDDKEDDPTTIIQENDRQDCQRTRSLRDAIALPLKEFLDKFEIIGKWICGLDLELNT